MPYFAHRNRKKTKTGPELTYQQLKQGEFFYCHLWIHFRDQKHEYFGSLHMAGKFLEVLCGDCSPSFFLCKRVFLQWKDPNYVSLYVQAKQQAFFVPSRPEVALKTLQNLAQLVFTLIFNIFLLLFNWLRMIKIAFLDWNRYVKGSTSEDTILHSCDGI